MPFPLSFPEYRPEINGLRALAVLSVVLFHAGVAGFGGGYVGIDIFFVITGYLLTGQLLAGLYGRGFSFWDFYARRARRIVPALLAMVVCTLAAGYFLLMPDALAEAGRAAQRTAYFFSNHDVAGLSSGRWDPTEQETQPLWHLWALAVGVQFMIALPVLLVLLWRVARRADTARAQAFGPPPLWVVRGVLFGLALLSFAVSDALLNSDPAAAFYMLASRAWEFLLGGLIASLAGSRLSRPPLWVAEIGSIVGLTSLLWGVLTYTQTTPFPAGHALVPVIGTCLLLYSSYCATPARVTRLLSWRGLVAVGLMSYSLYLWHWPLWVLTRSTVWSVYGLAPLPVPVYMAITLLLSWLSWRCIERPFQARRLAAGRPAIIVGAAAIACALCFAAGGWAVTASRVDQQRLPPVLAQLHQDTSVAPGVACEGRPELDAIRAGQSGCDLGDPASATATPDFILLGDSHARMWTSAFDTLARELSLHGVAMTYSNCTPLRGAVSPVRPECARITDAALEYAARSPVRQVILAGYWTEAAETVFANPTALTEGLPATQAFTTALRDTVRYLQQAGKAVTVVMDVPRLDHDDVPRDMALRSVDQNGADAFGPSLAEHMARQAQIAESLEAVWPQVQPFGIVDPVIELCATGQCLVAREGRTWYRNQHQITDDAAQALRSVFFPLLRSVSAPR